MSFRSRELQYLHEELKMIDEEDCAGGIINELWFTHEDAESGAWDVIAGEYGYAPALMCENESTPVARAKTAIRLALALEYRVGKESADAFMLEDEGLLLRLLQKMKKGE